MDWAAIGAKVEREIERYTMAHALTRKALAERCGMSPRTVTRLARGNGTKNSLAKFCKGIEVAVEDFLADLPSAPPPPATAPAAAAPAASAASSSPLRDTADVAEATRALLADPADGEEVFVRQTLIGTSMLPAEDELSSEIMVDRIVPLADMRDIDLAAHCAGLPNVQTRLWPEPADAIQWNIVVRSFGGCLLTYADAAHARGLRSEDPVLAGELSAYFSLLGEQCAPEELLDQYKQDEWTLDRSEYLREAANAAVNEVRYALGPTLVAASVIGGGMDLLLILDKATPEALKAIQAGIPRALARFSHSGLELEADWMDGPEHLLPRSTALPVQVVIHDLETLAATDAFIRDDLSLLLQPLTDPRLEELEVTEEHLGDCSWRARDFIRGRRGIAALVKATAKGRVPCWKWNVETATREEVLVKVARTRDLAVLYRYLADWCTGIVYRGTLEEDDGLVPLDEDGWLDFARIWKELGLPRKPPEPLVILGRPATFRAISNRAASKLKTAVLLYLTLLKSHIERSA